MSMTVVSVPVTKFSRKILLREHGTEPIHVKRSHPLWVYLRPHAEGDHAGSSHITAERSTIINIEVSYSLRETLRKNLNDAGLALHKSHVEWMLRFTWANTVNGVPALRALKSFYELYNLDDDDYDLGSAFRMWQRFKNWVDEKFDGKAVNFHRVDVLSFCRPGDDYGNPWTDDQLEQIADLVCQRLAAYERVPEYLLTQVAIWVFHKVGERRADEIAVKFGKSWSRVYAAIRKVRDNRKNYDRFRELTDPDTVKNLIHAE